jgi:hypothetical protein
MFSMVRTITHWANDDEMLSIKLIAPTYNKTTHVAAFLLEIKTVCKFKGTLLQTLMK